MPPPHDSVVHLQRRRQAHERPPTPAPPLAWCKQWLVDEPQLWKPWKLPSSWSPNRSPSTSTQTRTLASGIRDEWREGRTRARKRLWEIVKRVWEVVRLYWHMGSTPAPNSYCTPTLYTHFTLSKGERSRPVLGSSHFCENRSVPVLSYVMRTWSLFQSIYICMFGLVKTEQVLKIFIFSKLNRFSNKVIPAYIKTIDFPIRFSQPSFHSFWILLLLYYLLF
jgi:hypothetical protein